MFDDHAEAAPADRRRWRVVALTAIGVLLAAWLARLALGGAAEAGGNGSLRIVHEEDASVAAPATAAPAVPPVPVPGRGDPDEALAAGGLPAAGGVWRDLSPAPILTPARHLAAWTGRELVAVGSDRAAAFDPTSGRWRPLPAAHGVSPWPLVVAWTGREVLVWGDVSPDGDALARGARYEPASKSWRQIAWLDVELGSWPVAVWAGDRLLVWGDDEAGAAYDPRADAWQRISPLPLSRSGPAQAVWTGDEVVVWGEAAAPDTRRRRGGFTVAYDPAADRWRALAPPPLAGQPGSAVWTGREVVVLGGQDLRERNVFPDSAELPAGAALDPATGAWRVIGAPPGFDTPARMEQLQGLALAWTGEAVVVIGGYPEGAGLRYDPAADRWSALPSGPVDLVGAAAVWTGREVLLWGGYGHNGPDVGLAAWEPG